MARSPRRAASSRTAGAMPWALKTTVCPSGTSSSSSTKTTPRALKSSTTDLLCTISRRTYKGAPPLASRRSTTSMARSTPAQKPRGLTISRVLALKRAPSASGWPHNIVPFYGDGCIGPGDGL